MWQQLLSRLTLTESGPIPTYPPLALSTARMMQESSDLNPSSEVLSNSRELQQSLKLSSTTKTSRSSRGEMLTRKVLVVTGRPLTYFNSPSRIVRCNQSLPMVTRQSAVRSSKPLAKSVKTFIHTEVQTNEWNLRKKVSTPT